MTWRSAHLLASGASGAVAGGLRTPAGTSADTPTSVITFAANEQVSTKRRALARRIPMVAMQYRSPCGPVVFDDQDFLASTNGASAHRPPVRGCTLHPRHLSGPRGRPQPRSAPNPWPYRQSGQGRALLPGGEYSHRHSAYQKFARFRPVSGLRARDLHSRLIALSRPFLEWKPGFSSLFPRFLNPPCFGALIPLGDKPLNRGKTN